MTRSMKLPIGILILLLFAGATFLSLSTVVNHRVLGLGSTEYGMVSRTELNATLLRLSAIIPGEEQLRRDVAELLDGSFGRARGGRQQSLWRRENHPGRQPISRRGPKDYPDAPPEFRRSLRQWYRNRQLDPGVMSELVRLTKRPIDLSYGYPDTGRPYASCAVVGNSGILLKHEHGELIDGHDIVIRINNARVQGYQRHVGSKTSVSFINSNILHFCARRPRCFCHPYGDFVPIVMYVCQAAHFIDYAVCNSSHKSPLLITDARFDTLCSRIVKYYSLKGFSEETGRPWEHWGTTHDVEMFHYSSGMQAVMLAVGMCDRVSVFGFGKAADAKHHYHTNQRAELGLHDYAAEYAFYRDLAERPTVIPFLMDSGFKVPPVVFYH